MSTLFAQMLLDVHDELVIDLFAGGGGASSGFEQATGRQVDIAINHDAAAVSLHMANHPQTKHYVSDVFEVDPRKVTQGRGVAFLWASPDCTHHSKARGGKPLRDASRKRRALAWVVTRWAGQVSPRVIMLENVEEFAQWGPLVGPPNNLKPCPKRKGKTFRKWVRSLMNLGYKVECRELRACDYGAPTIRKRLFLIARRDGEPIVWPEPTHGPGRANPYRTAAECIDWSIPMLSIFATKEEAAAWGKFHGQPSPIRPLAENTERRIARGVKRYVLDNPKPYLVRIGQMGGNGGYVNSTGEPLTTITTKNEHLLVSPEVVNVANSKTTGRGPNAWPADDPLRTIPTSNGFAVVAPHLSTMRNAAKPMSAADEPTHTVTAGGAGLSVVAPFLTPRYGERDGQEPRCRSVESPSPVIVPGANGGSLVAANLVTYHNGPDADARSSPAAEPIQTLDCSNRHALAASFLGQNNGGFYEGDGRELDAPAATVLSNSRGHFPLMAAHIQRDFGTGVGHDLNEPARTITTEGGGKSALVASFLAKYYGTGDGQMVTDPVHTVPTVDRFGLVTVTIKGETYVVSDIAMRMLQPKELYAAQGFRPGYIIDRGADGRKLTKTEQVRMVGNSVCPPVAEALIRANVPELIVREIPKPRRQPARAKVIA